MEEGSLRVRSSLDEWCTAKVSRGSSAPIDESEGMVDVASKSETLRTATAQATIKVDATVIGQIRNGKSPKGNIVDAAAIAATMAAKRTWELIPYCHLIPIDSVKANVSINQ